jgi:DNA-binding response OmpR family regulator
VGVVKSVHDLENLRAGSLEVRTQEETVLAEGRPLRLSVREYRLLVALARRRDRVVSRAELFTTVWGRALREGDRSVDVYVRRLRVKLRIALPEWSYIHTHFGFGYRFSPEREAGDDGVTGLSHLVHKDALAS